MPTLTLPRPRGFSLAAATSFYASFTPGAGMASAATDELTFAFRLDGTFDAVGVMLREDEDQHALVAEVVGTDDEAAVTRQVGRMLGLHADGDAWHAVGKRDPVVGELQAEFPGFFTAAKASPYDAATWAIIAPRLPMRTAAKVKQAVAEAYGDAVTLRGRTHHVFPSPAVLAELGEVPGLSTEKRERLRGVARAASEGRLEAERLRAMPEREALTDLMTLRGVGPWAASHILYRGAALVDALPTAEPRVLHGAAAAYGVATPSVPEFQRMADAWRPFRMWVCVLLSRHLARTDGWRDKRLAGEREAAGRALVRRSE
jgi:DNA-3-methyladenine glycosylase II